MYRYGYKTAKEPITRDAGFSVTVSDETGFYNGGGALCEGTYTFNFPDSATLTVPFTANSDTTTHSGTLNLTWTRTGTVNPTNFHGVQVLPEFIPRSSKIFTNRWAIGPGTDRRPRGYAMFRP